MKQRLLGKYLLPLLTTAFVVVAGGTSFIAIADDNTGTETPTTGTGNETTEPTSKAPSVEFSKSEDGKTLVITASGDLSAYKSTVQTIDKQTFSNAATTKIATQENLNSFVQSGNDYYSTTQYYEVNVKYEPLDKNNFGTYFNSPTYTWSDFAKEKNLYLAYYDPAQKFTSEAVNNVYTDNNGTKTSVTSGGNYDSNTTYYYPNFTVEYKQITSNNQNTYLNNETVWNKENLKSGHLYAFYKAWDGTYIVNSNGEETGSTSYVDLSQWITIDGKEYSASYVETDGTALTYGQNITPTTDGTGSVRFISKEDFLSKYYVTTYTVKSGYTVYKENADGAATIDVNGTTVKADKYTAGSQFTNTTGANLYAEIRNIEGYEAYTAGQIASEHSSYITKGAWKAGYGTTPKIVFSSSVPESGSYTYENQEYAKYFIVSSSLSLTAGQEVTPSTDGKGDVQLITKDEFLKDYVVTNYTPKGSNVLKKVEEGTEGATTITVGEESVTALPLTANVATSYDESTDVFYVPSAEGSTFTKIGDNNTYFLQTHPEYLTTTYKSSELDFVGQVEAKLEEGKYSSIRFVKAEGGDDITITADQLNSITSYTGTSDTYIALQGNSSVVDLSQVGSITGLTGESPTTIGNSKNSVSIILPNSLNDADAKAAARNISNGNIYWISDDNVTINVQANYPAKLSSVASVEKTTDTNNIVAYNTNSSSSTAASDIKNLDLPGIANLDIRGMQGTVKISGLSDLNGYSNIHRIVLPNNKFANDQNKVWVNKPDGYQSSIQVMQSLENYTDNTGNPTGDQILRTKLLTAGALDAIKEDHYTNEDFAKAMFSDFEGPINDADIQFFTGVSVKRISLANATYKGSDKAQAEKDFLGLVNTKGLEYIVLPDLGIDGGNFKEMFNNNKSLKGVAQGNSVGHSFAAALNNAAGTMDVLTTMFSNNLVGGDNPKGIVNLKLSGDLNAKDITQNAVKNEIKTDDGHGYSFKDTYLSKDGHWVAPDADGDGKQDDNVATDQTGALTRFSTVMESLDYSDAKFATNEDLTIAYTGLGNSSTLKKVFLPTDHSFTTISHCCFRNLKGLVGDSTVTPMQPGVIIPGNIKRIERYAFSDNVSISLVGVATTMTNSHGDGTYNPDSIIYNGKRSLTLPEKLAFVGTGAFGGDDRFHDVYVLAKTAPECEVDAFDSDTYTGNNGFNAANGVSQAAYMKEEMSFAVLHYPSALMGTDEEKNYTDVKRVYTLQDNTGATDANGNVLMWPSQDEWNHAYVTAYTQYLWNAWSKEKTTEKQLDFNNIITTDKSVVDDLYASNGSPADATYSSKYIGWHQFILSNRMNGVKDKTDPVRDLSRYKSNDWYTICVPYNIRKNDLQKAFGVVVPSDVTKVTVVGKGDVEVDASKGLYPDVVTLVGVKRQESAKTITLIFSKNLIDQDVTVDHTGKAPTYTPYSDDNPIIIHEGRPYLIRPYMPDFVAKLEKYVVSIAENDADEHVTYGDRKDLRIPVDDHIVMATDGISTDGSNYGTPLTDWKYRFGGAYSNHDLPNYSYYLSRSKSKGKNIWFYLNSTTKKRSWNMYAAIITANAENVIDIPTPEEIKLQGKNPVYIFKGVNDELTGVAKAKTNYVMAFDEDNGTTTGITEIDNKNKEDAVEYIDGQPILTDPHAKVYTIGGQYVGNSLIGLTKGIYIVNGKKYVVK